MMDTITMPEAATSDLYVVTASVEARRVRLEGRTRRVLITGLLVLLILLASPRPNLLNYLVPVFAVVAGWAILEASPTQYFVFTFWLWFLIPMLRRMVDARSFSSAEGTILLSSYFASCVPLYHLVWSRRKILDRFSVPLVLMSMAVLYGILYGLTRYSPAKCVQSALTWAAPITFAFFIYQHRQRFSDLFGAFEKTMVWGTLVMGAYGVIQYFLLPTWDSLWMINLDNVTFGSPHPLELRVFSTMNAPQLLGIYLAIGLLISLQSTMSIRVLAVPFGVVSLIFTQARSAWVCLLVGFFFVVLKGSLRLRLQVLGVAVVAGLGIVIALQNPTVSENISKRFNTLSQVGSDDSFLSRTEGHIGLFEGLLDVPFGLGFGGVQAGTPASKEDALMKNGKGVMQADSTIAGILNPFGMPGALLAIISAIFLIKNVFEMKAPVGSPAGVLRILTLAFFAIMPLDNVMYGPSGFLCWAVIGLDCAARSQAVGPRLRDLQHGSVHLTS